MSSNKRAQLRRDWRLDRKHMSVRIPWRAWTPTYFNDVKKKIREYREARAK